MGKSPLLADLMFLSFTQLPAVIHPPKLAPRAIPPVPARLHYRDHEVASLR